MKIIKMTKEEKYISEKYISPLYVDPLQKICIQLYFRSLLYCHLIVRLIEES